HDVFSEAGRSGVPESLSRANAQSGLHVIRSPEEDPFPGIRESVNAGERPSSLSDGHLTPPPAPRAPKGDLLLRSDTLRRSTRRAAGGPLSSRVRAGARSKLRACARTVCAPVPQ